MTKDKIKETGIKKSAYRPKIIPSSIAVNKIKSSINVLLELTGSFKFIHTYITKLFSKRERFSREFIKGEGIEIGALHLPLKVYKAKVTYVDRMNVGELRQHYPELRKFSLINVDIVDNGETLRKIKNESQDIDHINNDFKKGGRYSRKLHYYEWTEKIGFKKDILKKSEEFMSAKYSIHFYVWTSIHL